MFLATALLAERNKAEMAVFGGHIHLVAHFNFAFLAQPVGYKVAYGQHVQAMLAGKLLQLRHAGHGAVFVKDFNQTGSRMQAGHAGQVDGCLSMPCAGQHAAVLRIKRIDMAGTAESLRGTLGVGQRLDGFGTVMTAYAGGTAFKFVNGYRKRGAQHAGIVLNLMFQFQHPTAFVGNRRTQHATSVFQHEVHFFRRNEFGGRNQVAFVLAVLVVNYNHELSFTKVLYGLFYRSEFK